LESRLIDPWKYLVWIFEELPKAKVSADTFAPNRVRPHSLSRDPQGLRKKPQPSPAKTNRVVIIINVIGVDLRHL
jgi:hypothetical protein